MAEEGIFGWGANQFMRAPELAGPLWGLRGPPEANWQESSFSHPVFGQTWIVTCSPCPNVRIHTLYSLGFTRISTLSTLTCLTFHNAQWRCLYLGDITMAASDRKVYLFPDVATCHPCDVTKRPTSVG